MKKNLWLFILFSLCIFSMIVILFSQVSLPWFYYFLSISIAILIISMLHQLNPKWTIYASFVLSILLSNIYNVINHFDVIPLLDSYADYVAIRVFMENGRVYQFSLSSINTLYPSSWPLGPIFTMIFSMISNIDVVQSCLLLPSVYGAIMWLLIVLFWEVLFKPMDDLACALSLLIFAVSPEMVYDRMIFYHRFFGQTLFFIVLYLLAREFLNQRLSRNMCILLILFSGTMVMFHLMPSIVWTLFLICFIALAKIGKLLSPIKRNGARFFVISTFAFPLLTLSLISIWMVYFAFPVLNQLVQYSSHIFPLNPQSFLWELDKPTYIPEALASPLMVLLLRLRAFAIYVPAAIGILIFLRDFMLKKKKNARNVFLLFSLISFGVGVLASYAAIPLFGPLLFIKSYVAAITTCFAGSFYAILLRKGKSNIRRTNSILTSFLLMFIIFTAFISPWSHRYSASFLYDPSIKAENVGAHNPEYLHLAPLVRDRISLEGKAVLSDDGSLLYIILQPKDYNAIHRYVYEYEYKYVQNLLRTSDTYIFELNNLNPVLGYAGHTLRDVLGLEQKDVDKLGYNRILDGYCYRIHYEESHDRK